MINTYGDLDTYESEGVIEFTLKATDVDAAAVHDPAEAVLHRLPRRLERQETYEAARFLYADLLDDGTTVLDFNEAYNPPCSFNPYTTCPIPIPENRLPVKVLAGEKAYPVHVELPSKGTAGR